MHILPLCEVVCIGSGWVSSVWLQSQSNTQICRLNDYQNMQLVCEFPTATNARTQSAYYWYFVEKFEGIPHQISNCLYVHHNNIVFMLSFLV